MTNTTALFPGDKGDLSADTRRVLVNLLRGPTIDGQRQTQLWAHLLRDEAIVRARLHDLFLTLVLDTEQLVAFTQQADTEDLDAPTLLRKSTLTFKETALLLFLRSELAVADAQGERCVLDRQDLVEHLKAYTPLDDNDSVRYDKQSDAAIEKVIKLSLMHKLKGSDTRLEVSQALRLMFSITEIEALTGVYEALRTGEPTGEATDTNQIELALDDEAQAEIELQND